MHALVANDGIFILSDAAPRLLRLTATRSVFGATSHDSAGPCLGSLFRMSKDSAGTSPVGRQEN